MTDRPLPPRATAIAADLAAHGIQTEVRRLDESTHTAVAAAAALGVEVGAIASSLVFSYSAEEIEAQPLLVMTSGAHRVDTAMLGAALDGEIQRADAAFVKEATGQPIGGCAPIGHPQRIRTIVDEALAAHPILWAAAGTPDTIFSLTFDELVAITSGEVRRVGA